MGYVSRSGLATVWESCKFSLVVKTMMTSFLVLRWSRRVMLDATTCFAKWCRSERTAHEGCPELRHGWNLLQSWSGCRDIYNKQIRSWLDEIS